MVINSITYTNSQIENYLLQVYRGNITLSSLPIDLYNAIADDLLDDMYRGYGGKLNDFEIGTKKYNNLNSLRRNLYMFAGSKTFQQVSDIQKLKINKKGFLVSFNDFKKKALPIYSKYNDIWQSAEADASWKQADSASKWQEFEDEADLLPLLRFETVNDDRVRDEHREYDGIVRPVNDSFWNTFMPPLGWRCRCEAVQVEDEKVTPRKKLRSLEKPDKVFRNNPGKTGQVFDDKHPYFKVGKKWEKERDNNFGLNIPD